METKKKKTANIPETIESQMVIRNRTKGIILEYNNLYASQKEQRQRIMEKLLGHFGTGSAIEQPFHCDYGYNIHIGKNFYANTGCLLKDKAMIKIGDNVMFGPNVGIYTSGHPFGIRSENNKMPEYILPVTIGNDVWVGGNVIILAGVTIGDNAMIGAGSIVTCDIPADTIAAGNPARVIKKMIES
ncbi:sugar O-acetyltransferase [Dysgonomonas sp. 521]|uniref:sugar O-acetyltransferase n=1 Tax=Dysgonomonas sp. 521 TaxID=2302932 RepID=UPI0013D4BF52|nr:sugar O-acetyltransferase [Dysgonomonas sp. 521]NDV96040.1 sugar O-acetyltransferase [Dysgonomonas sp. 521]